MQLLIARISLTIQWMIESLPKAHSLPFGLGVILGTSFLLVGITGCSVTPAGGDHRARLEAVLLASKSTSLFQWENKTMLDAAAYQTAIIIKGAKSVELARLSSSSNLVTLSYSAGPGSECAIGSAVPIAPDGYFLTARHCLNGNDKSFPTLVAFTLEGKALTLKKARPRIVWSATKEDGVDLAVIHVPIRPIKAFSLASIESLSRGDRVAVTGWSCLANGKFDPMFSNAAGRIVALPIQSSAEHKAAIHTCPIIGGDSGGPLLTSGGELIGVNTQARFLHWDCFRSALGLGFAHDRPIPSYSGLAVIPDAGRLEAIIKEDRGFRRHKVR